MTCEFIYMTPDVFMMPALGVVLAALVPQLLVRGIASLFERVDTEVDAHAAAIGPCLTCVGLLSFWGVRSVGPTVVDRPGAPLSLLAGVTLGALAGVSAFKALGAIPPSVAPARPPLGAAIGGIVSALMVVAAVLLWRKTDLVPADIREVAYAEDDAKPQQLLAVERRVQVDPWDPEIYLVRAWHSVVDGHHARALSDLAIARRVGAGAAPLRALEADTLAAMGRCDDARIAFDAWQRARAAEAMATHFGHELEVLPAAEQDPQGPSRYFRHCHAQDFYEGE